MSFDMHLLGESDVFDQTPGGIFGITYFLAFWQKHYALHELILEKFGGTASEMHGKTKIYLYDQRLLDLITFIKDGTLIYDDRRMSLNKYTAADDISKILFAYGWLLNGPGHRCDRSVLYSAV